MARSLVRLIVVLGLAGSATGCGSGQPPTASAVTLPFPGGYVNLPDAENWQMQQMPSPGSAASRLLTPTQTIAAVVQYHVASSDEEAFVYLTQGPSTLQGQAATVKESFGQGRYRLRSFEAAQSNWKGADCIDYQAEFDDLEFPGHKGSAYPGRANGRMCVLTDRADRFLVLLKLEYSERRSTSEQPYPGFEVEARDFFSGLVIER